MRPHKKTMLKLGDFPEPMIHLTSPHLTSPHLTSPHLTSPHLTSPHLTSPHLTSPHLTSPHLTSPPRQAGPTPPATRPGLLPGPEVQPVRGRCTTATHSAPARYLVAWHQDKNPDKNPRMVAVGRIAHKHSQATATCLLTHSLAHSPASAQGPSLPPPEGPPAAQAHPRPPFTRRLTGRVPPWCRRRIRAPPWHDLRGRAPSWHCPDSPTPPWRQSSGEAPSWCRQRARAPSWRS